MSRLNQLVQAMGLGPLWVKRLPNSTAADWTTPAHFIVEAPSTGDNEPYTPQTTMPRMAAHALALASQKLAAAHVMPTSSTTEALVPAAVSETAAPTLDINNWDELKEAALQCQRCNLCKTRTNVVFGEGSTKAKWMIIGEAPGREEDLQGKPFVGRAGQLLNNMLGALKLDREQDVFIANVLKCRPPNNRNPALTEVALCEVFLKTQIRLIQPDIILSLGRFASQTLLGDTQSIQKLRGKVHHYQDIPLIVSYHPAYLLRNPSEKAKSWQDLILAKNTLANSYKSQ